MLLSAGTLLPTVRQLSPRDTRLNFNCRLVSTLEFLTTSLGQIKLLFGTVLCHAVSLCSYIILHRLQFLEIKCLLVLYGRTVVGTMFLAISATLLGIGRVSLYLKVVGASVRAWVLGNIVLLKQMPLQVS